MDHRKEDIDEIRKKLENYYGTAVHSGFPNAQVQLDEIEDLDAEEVIALARELDLFK